MRTRSAVCAALAAALVAASLAGASRPLAAPDFAEIAVQGFGDRQNSIPWAMIWWRGALYVGTNRAFSCTAQWALNRTISSTLFPYPPPDPDLACAADPADLSLQAEIWRWMPDSDTWTRLYQSPADVANPDRPGKLVPRDMGFRTMALHREADGTEALYVGGISTKMMWHGRVPAPRLLRSVDGETFVPVPQDEGTTLGTLPKSSLRTLTSFDGRLFVINGDPQGGGTVLASANPAAGNDAWFQLTPPELRVFEMHVFANQLYLGVVDSAGGYAVLKTRAQGDPLVPVIERGGYLIPPSDGVLSMHVHKNRLYVGTGTVFFPIHEVELLRINPDDSWDLVVGDPRETPGGWKFPLTGLSDGFANGFNDHVWRMQASGDDLFLGTYDSSTEWRLLPGLLPHVQHLLGFDLFRTSDGWYMTAVSTDGLGDSLSFGVRNFAETPFGLVLGAANPYYGLRLWRGVPSNSPVLPPPARLETESLAGGTLLSWLPVPDAARYAVLRTRMRTVSILPGILGEPRIPGPYAEVAATTGTTYVDTPPPGEYLYFVVAVAPDGRRSTPSNLVQVPARFPPVGFPTLLSMITSMESRGLFVSEQAAAAVRGAVMSAEAAFAAGNLPTAIATLFALRPALLTERVVRAPHNIDLEVVVSRLARRLALAHAGYPVVVGASR